MKNSRPYNAIEKSGQLTGVKKERIIKPHNKMDKSIG